MRARAATNDDVEATSTITAEEQQLLLIALHEDSVATHAPRLPLEHTEIPARARYSQRTCPRCQRHGSRWPGIHRPQRRTMQQERD